MSSKTKFNEIWLKEVKYVQWLQKNHERQSSFKCKLCMKSYELNNMGKRALDAHANGKKHKERMADYQSSSASSLIAWSRSSTSRLVEFFFFIFWRVH